MKALNFMNQLVGKTNSADDKGAGNTDLTNYGNEILVIDDDELTRKLVKRLLDKEFSLDIATFSNGIEGLEYAKKQTPRLIILDLMLPGMNGFEILKEIRETPTLKDTKVVLISAKSRSEDIETGFDLSADEYITKPFKPQEFTARLKKLLKKAA
jgi:two-component system alkaline phosphatase synthesis response regulator PhoP